MTKKQKKQLAAKKLKTKMKQYQITHKRHGCYEIIFVDESLEVGKFKYMTNFRNKKAAKNFVEQHALGNVTIDPETHVPTPDFK
jgi:tRNA uridine 5-carbamoylmethylation protein Kti12